MGQRYVPNASKDDSNVIILYYTVYRQMRPTCPSKKTLSYNIIRIYTIKYIVDSVDWPIDDAHSFFF